MSLDGTYHVTGTVPVTLVIEVVDDQPEVQRVIVGDEHFEPPSIYEDGFIHEAGEPLRDMEVRRLLLEHIGSGKQEWPVWEFGW